jgi:hypothetical protein
MGEMCVGRRRLAALLAANAGKHCREVGADEGAISRPCSLQQEIPRRCYQLACRPVRYGDQARQRRPMRRRNFEACRSASRISN